MSTYVQRLKAPLPGNSVSKAASVYFRFFSRANGANELANTFFQYLCPMVFPPLRFAE